MKKLTKTNSLKAVKQQQIKWLRPAVLGANDGIISVAGLSLGIAGATNSPQLILLAGFAGTIAGVISMSIGEYVSVSSLKDNEKALLEIEKYELKNHPKEELKELIQIYKSKGLSQKTAEVVAKELSKKNAFAAHAHAELNLDPENLTNPLHAAFFSAGSFFLGASIPLLTILFSPDALKAQYAFISVIFALTITGIISAKVGKANILQAVLRIVLGGTLAMIATYCIGKIFSVSI